MTPTIRKEQVKALVGKQVYAVKKDGSIVTGKLVSIKGTTLHVRPASGKKMKTKAFVPLALFDLLAIGSGPFGGFGPGFGFGGFGPGFGGGFGPGFGGGFGPGFGGGFGGFGGF